MTFLVGIICLFVGWNLPQPVWAQVAQAKVVAWFKAHFGSDKPAA